MPSVRVLLAEEAAKLASKRKKAKGRSKSGSCLSFKSKFRAQEQKLGRGRTVRKDEYARTGEVEGDGSAQAGSRKPDISIGTSRRAERSSDFDSLGAVGTRVTYSSEKVPNALIEITSPTTWQEDFSL